MFESPGFAGHESLHHFYDEDSGLRAIIALHSTARGPGGGGCRMWNYATADEAISDALRLSQGMSYKNAVADLPLGGGKAVVWGDPHKDKSPELFRALGRAIDSLNGAYWSAEDVGVTPADMAYVREETRYVAGLDEGEAASGDPSPVTARGVFMGMQAAAERAFGTTGLSNRVIAIQGAGNVGGGVCRLAADAGAKLYISDVNQDALQQIAEETGATIVDPDAIYDVEMDIFSPNALGGSINTDTLKRLSCKLIAGGANNQLATPDMGAALQDKGVVYAPDFVINGGGIINIASEISGVYDPAWVDKKLDGLVETLMRVIDEAAQREQPAHLVAEALAHKRIAEAASRKT
ncbi:MAG: Glu/Leu/Phe/Val dehydrogenase [Pseudomonadota bacterium]